MPTVTLAHWDPELASTDPEHVKNKLLKKEPGEGYHPVATRLDHEVGVHPVVPVCPQCGAAVEEYSWPGQTSLDWWQDPVVLRVRPCNHALVPADLGIPVEVNAEGVEYAPRP